ncbi:MAG: hypothetical protein U5L02_06465 [Rheinheimera sp.]|nr:hypothetical protein [Rheinheimera sp.]
MSLHTELSKAEYSGLTNEQALAALKAVTVIEGNLIPATTINQLFASLDLTGFIQDIAADHQHPFRHKMASVILSIGGDHPFNFTEGTTAGEGNLSMLNAMIAQLPELAAQLSQFKALVHAMANKKRPFAGVSLADVIKARAVQLDGQWHEIEETSNRQFVVRSMSAPPEPTSIIVQAQDQYGDGVSDWYHATAIHGINGVREHQASLPYNGYPRKLRWKCDFNLNFAVSLR